MGFLSEKCNNKNFKIARQPVFEGGLSGDNG